MAPDLEVIHKKLEELQEASKTHHDVATRFMLHLDQEKEQEKRFWDRDWSVLMGNVKDVRDRVIGIDRDLGALRQDVKHLEKTVSTHEDVIKGMGDVKELKKTVDGHTTEIKQLQASSVKMLTIGATIAAFLGVLFPLAKDQLFPRKGEHEKVETRVVYLPAGAPIPADLSKP